MKFVEKTRRHYFEVELPEELRTEKSTTATAYLDVYVENGENHLFEWGCIFEGSHIQPNWITTEIIKHELTQVKFK
jgi:hypothetical protein